ncbi:hypothetical protein C8J57DRAFT_1711957 [Mycena rebaudengoi]|nr:hypothetical protein C8J57DRAFT_1711957 [Mycena rebaudengoi]
MATDVNLNEDLWHLVTHGFIDIWKLPPHTIDGLQYLSHSFQTIFQRYLYRHVNLRSPHRARAFFRTLTIRPDLAEKILTLQFSFELQHCTQGFWLGFRGQLPRMTALQNLSITYSHQDEDCLHRILDHGNLAALLPPSVQTLHLKPLYQLIYQECCVSRDLEAWEEAFPDDGGPWCSSLWRLSLAQIPHFSELIVTTPVYVIWPPNSEQMTSVFNQWTAQLRKTKKPSSSLRKITINSAFADNCKRIREYRQNVEEVDSELRGG